VTRGFNPVRTLDPVSGLQNGRKLTETFESSTTNHQFWSRSG